MLEQWILYGSLTGTVLALLLFVPKQKLRDAAVLMFFPQLITWLFGLLVVEMGLIEYPYRSLPKVARSSLDFEFVVYPALIVLFNLHYPENGTKVKQALVYVLVTGAITLFEGVLEQYTDLIEYTGWAWYWTFLTVGMTFYISRRYYVWFRQSLTYR